MKLLNYSLACALGLLTLAGCQNTNTYTPEKVMPNKNINLNQIQTDAASVTFSKAELTKYTWHLQSATNANNQPIVSLNNAKDDVRLTFTTDGNEDRVGFGVGCNSMGSSYTLVGNTLQVGNIFSTQMLCQELDDAEKQLVASMQERSVLQFNQGNPSTLVQIAKNGSTLIWQGELTAEAKYGNQTDYVYWQIDPNFQSCTNSTEETCLKVRPVFYDEQGIKTGVGEWSLFVGKIEGYSHDPSLDQIVRLKRFVIDPMDVKGKQFVYVFDTVVESGSVK